MESEQLSLLIIDCHVRMLVIRLCQHCFLNQGKQLQWIIACNNVVAIAIMFHLVFEHLSALTQDHIENLSSVNV